MVRAFKRTATAETKVPVLWHDHAWSARVRVLPDGMASGLSLTLPAPARGGSAGLSTGGWSARGRWHGPHLAKSGFAGGRARLACVVVSLPARRKREQAPRALSQSGPLLGLAALPLGGSASPHLNIRHLFKNTPSDLI